MKKSYEIRYTDGSTDTITSEYVQSEDGVIRFYDIPGPTMAENTVALFNVRVIKNMVQIRSKE